MQAALWLCIVMCPVPLSAVGKPPIRVMGFLGLSPPVAPHEKRYNPLVPCNPEVTDSPCDRGGFPDMKAWLDHYRSDARGAVTFSTPDFRSRTVLAHPDGLRLNYAAWDRLGLDFVTMRNDHFLSSSAGLDLEDFVLQSRHPWVMSDFLVDNTFPFLAHLLSSVHIKEIDGVKVGVLLLWSDTFTGRSNKVVAHSTIVPLLTRRLREAGVSQIVALRTEQRSSRSDEFLTLTSYDIDVVVSDVVPREAAFTVNGTTVLYASPFYPTRHMLVVLSMVELGGGGWNYTLQYQDLHRRTPPGNREDPAFLESKLWIHEQVALCLSNDIVIATSTGEMPGERSGGLLVCLQQECEVGVMTADAMALRANTEIAIVNAGATRGVGWPAGPIRMTHLWDTYPFANAVCRVNVSGTVLLDIVNKGISLLQANGASNRTNRAGLFLQISGFRFQMNPGLPVGSRVVSLDVRTPEGRFAPLEKRHVYSMAVTNFLLGGGDGYDMLAANHQAGTQQCLVTTLLEAVQEYLTDVEVYTPHLGGRIAVDFEGEPMAMMNQSHGNCTNGEAHDLYWQDCVPCRPGFWRPDLSGNVCIEKAASEGANVGLIAGVFAGVVLVLAIPLVWKLTEKQRRINALYNNNKVAEECAVAVMELRLSDLDYLKKIERPNQIQRAFMAIVNQMEVYMEFMPKNLIANCQHTDNESDASVVSGSSSPCSQMSGLTRQSSVDSTSTIQPHSKRVCILAFNSKDHTLRCAETDLDKVRGVHSQLIHTFNTVVWEHKGLAESMCGDRLLAAWNTVVERPAYITLACRAAYGLRDIGRGIVSHIGLAIGPVTFGLFGGAGTKKYDIVGKAVPGAMLLALLNKEYGTRCLLTRGIAREAAGIFNMRIVDYVSHPALADATFLYELDGKKHAPDNWMHSSGESMTGPDPFQAANDAWITFVRTGELPKHLRDNGKLAELKQSAFSGEYCCTCPGLALF